MQIVKFLNDVCNVWKEKTNIYFSTYGSPSESLCYTFAKKFKQQFPELNFEHEYLEQIVSSSSTKASDVCREV